MKVASLALAMRSSYSFSQSVSFEQSLSASGPARATPDSPIDQVSLSPNGVSASKAPTEDQDLSPMLSLIKSILEHVLGVHFHLLDGRLLPGDGRDDAGAKPEPAAPPPAQTAIAAHQSVDIAEQQSLNFAAQGKVTTQDGQEFQFSLNVSMQQSFEYHASSDWVNGKQKHDPMMLTLDEKAGSFSGASVSFQLQAGGAPVDLPFAQNGGWLVLDNGDGKVRDGSQLFGTQSGNGFADLAKLDANHNGVLDDSDPAFARLKLWRGRDKNGKDELVSLKSLGIGAILLPSIDTPFQQRDAAHEPQADWRRSGAYLTEDGKAGLLSQVDVYG